MSQLPDIYATTPISLAPAETIAQFPVNTFLENLAVAANGEIFVTNHEIGDIIRLSTDGTITTQATIAGKVSGIACVDAQTLLVNGWTSEGVPFVALVSATTDNTIEFMQPLPDAMFLNGITPLTPETYLMADSYRGAIWAFSPADRQLSLWLEHPLLARSDASSAFPAANGLKRFGSHLYVSNTQQMLLLKIPLDTHNHPLEPEIFVEGTNIDDFAFDDQGNLYGATHVYNSVLRIDSQGATTIIAQAEQGVTGCTAVAFGKSEADRTALYVVNNGGMFLPPETGVEPARIVRLAVGAVGAPLGFAGA